MPRSSLDLLSSSLASREAKAFIDRAPPLVHDPISLATINDRRAEALASFTPASRRAISRHSVMVDETTIAGIGCQEVRSSDGTLRRPARTVLYFFGGGYALGSPFEELPITAALADWANARVVVPYYRLAPEHPYPAAIEDGMAVYRALVKMQGGDPLVVAGESAGGNLALTVLARARAEGLPMPCAAALLSPWADLNNAGDSIDSNAMRDPTLDPFLLADFARAYTAGADRLDPDVSPIFADFDKKWPPFIVTTGTRDLLMSQSIRLTQVMRRRGVDVDLRIWDGLWHVFEFYDDLPEAAQSLAEIASFLDAHFDRTAKGLAEGRLDD